MRLVKLAFDGSLRFHRANPRGGAVRRVCDLSFQFVCDLLDLHQDFPTKVTAGFTALIVALTFFSGVLLFFLGVIGEYVGRIYEETKARPQYIVGRTVV